MSRAMAKALTRGIKSWFKATRESTETLAKRAIKGEVADPVLSSKEVTEKVIAEMGNPRYIGEARRIVGEEALKNPKFGFVKKYKPQVEGVKNITDSLEAATIQAEIPIQALRKKKSGLRSQLKTLTGTSEAEINERNAIQQMIAATDTEIKKAKMSDIVFPEAALTKLKQQASILGMSPDIVEADLKSHNFTGLRDKLDKIAEQNAYRDYTLGVRDLAYDRKIGKEVIEGVFRDSKLNYIQKGAKLTQMVEAADRAMDKALDKAGVKIAMDGFKDSWLTGVESKLGDSIRYFGQKGHKLASESLNKFADLLRTAPAARAKLKQLKYDLLLREQSLGAERSNAIKFYMTNRDYEKAVMLNDGALKDAIKANPELIEPIFKKYGVKLTYEDMKFANQKASVLRETLRYRAMMERGAYDEAAQGLPKKFNAIEGKVISRADENFGIADVGVNYHPRVGNEKWLERYERLHPEDVSTYRDSIRDNDYGQQMKFFEKARTNSKELTLDENTLPAHEEIAKYFSGMEDLAIRREGLRQLNEVKFYSRMPLGDVKTRNLKGEHQYIQALEKQWKRNFNPKSAEDLNPLGKLLLVYTKFAVPIALTGQKMIPSNTIQALFTSSYKHGLIRTMAATGLQLTKFGATVVMHPTRIKDAFDIMAQGDLDRALITGKNVGLAKVLHRAQRNDPGLHTMIDEDFKSIMSATGTNSTAKIQRAFNWLGQLLTFPFACSDQISRRAAMTSAYWHGESSLKNYSRNIKNGMKRDTATAQLAKELHLGAFNLGNDFNYIIKSIDPDDIARTAPEMLYRYATRSMRQSIFDYSAINQSGIKGMVKEINPLFGAAMTFTSWPMYFHELGKGALLAWKMGDKVPLTKLILGGMATFAATSHIMGTDSEYQKLLKPAIRKGGLTGYAASWASEMPGYLQARAPGLSYAAFVEKTTASPAGILSPAVGIISYPIIKGLNEVSIMMGNNSGKGHLDFAERTAVKFAKSEMVYRKILSATETLKEAGLIDKDLEDIIKGVSR